MPNHIYVRRRSRHAHLSEWIVIVLAKGISVIYPESQRRAERVIQRRLAAFLPVGREFSYALQRQSTAGSELTHHAVMPGFIRGLEYRRGLIVYQSCGNEGQQEKPQIQGKAHFE